MRYLLIPLGLAWTVPVIFVWLLAALCLWSIGVMSTSRTFKQYAFNLALSLDQLVNVLLLGDPDESISGRLGRALLSGEPKYFVKPMAAFVDWIFKTLADQDQHCLLSVELEDQPHQNELWSWQKK